MPADSPHKSLPVNQALPGNPVAALTFTAFAGTMALLAFVAVAGPISELLMLSTWQLGLVMSISGIAWMVSARFWGVMSDRVGRRRIILIGVAGFALSYAALTGFLAVAVPARFALVIALAGLILGRGAMGAFYSSVPTLAAAIVADLAKPEQRAAKMAGIGAASSLGMVVGPGLAGLIGRYDLILPLAATLVLPIIAFALLYIALPKDRPAEGARRAPLGLMDRRLRLALVMAVLASMAVAVAQTLIGFLLIDRLGMVPADAASGAGTALAIVGVSLFATQLVVRKLARPPRSLLAIGSLLAASGFACAALSLASWQVWGAYALIACGMGCIYPAVPALATNSVSAQEHGGAAGAVTTAQGLGIVIGPLFGGFLYEIAPGLAFATMTAAFLSAAIVLARAPRE